MSWNSGKTCSMKMVLLSTNQNCHRKSNPWAWSWTVFPFVAVSVVKDFGLCGELWTRFFGEGRSLDVPLKWSLVTSPSCFSVPDLHNVHTAHVLSFHAHTLSRGDSPLDRNAGRTGCGSGSFEFLPERMDASLEQEGPLHG